MSRVIVFSHLTELSSYFSKTGEKSKERLAQRVICGLDPKLNSYLTA